MDFGACKDTALFSIDHFAAVNLVTFDLLYKNHSLWTLEHVKTQHVNIKQILTLVEVNIQ